MYVKFPYSVKRPIAISEKTNDRKRLVTCLIDMSNMRKATVSIHSELSKPNVQRYVFSGKIVPSSKHGPH